MPRGPEEDDGRELYTIPSSSAWFQWDEIHETERRSLPEFFDWSSAARTPRIYREYRDFIISKFREDPARRLTFTETRKSLIGDVGALRAVFLFLERWGLINFGVSDGAQEEEGRGGGADGPKVVVEEGPPPGVQVVSLSQTSSSAVGEGENGFRFPPLTSYSDVFGEWTPGRGLVCGVCGEQCVSGRREPMKGNFVTCPKCFEKNCEDARSGDDSKPSDEDADINHVNSSWTDTETLLLLEGVLKHGDDWDLIAQHVRMKSKVDCIARLIQLPFGEHILNATSNKHDNKISNSQIMDAKVNLDASSELAQEPIKIDDQHENNPDEKPVEEPTPIHPAKRSRVLSFTDATESLTKQVAFLSTVAGPHIASAAADAAVTALCQENPYARKAFSIDEETMEKLGSTANNGQQSWDKVEDGNSAVPKQTDMTESTPEKNFAAMAFRIRAAAATGIGAVAARAKLLADQEDREIEHLMATIIEMQLRKINHKVKHLEELTSIMEKEYIYIQQHKDSILEDWFRVLQQMIQAGVPRWRDMDFPRSLLLAIL